MKMHKNNQKGFTLIELLVAMSIFIIFVGILINSYSSIIRSQREANEYRIMYAEARRTFETIVDEVRAGVIDYCGDNNESKLSLISKDLSSVSSIAQSVNQSRTYIEYIEPTEDTKGVVRLNSDFSSFDLNSSDVSVTDFKFYLFPSVDPYNQENVYSDDVQFHPRVTIYAQFERDGISGEPLVMELQTSVSSRVYNQACQNVF